MIYFYCFFIFLQLQIIEYFILFLSLNINHFFIKWDIIEQASINISFLSILSLIHYAKGFWKQSGFPKNRTWAYLKFLMEITPRLKTGCMGRFSLIRLWCWLKKVSALYISIVAMPSQQPRPRDSLFSKMCVLRSSWLINFNNFFLTALDL